MLKFTRLILALLFLSAPLHGDASYDKASDAELAVNKVIGQAIKLLSKKYRLTPFGTSIAMPGNIVNELGLHFQILGPLPLSELRKIVIESSRDFLNLVNQTAEIKPFLKVNPFTLKNVEIVLFVIDKEGEDVEYPEIGTATFSNGYPSYTYFVEEKGIPIVKKELEETYEEAVKALEQPSSKS